MHSFLKEPSRLASEQQRIRGDMVDLALRYYPVFVAASVHHTNIMTELQKCKSATDSIVSGLAGLQGNYDDFVTKSNDWKRAKASYGNLMSQQGKVQELLEAPQLLDTCFRNEMFHEAVLVLQHMRTMVEQHGSLPLIARVAQEVDDIVNSNVQHLLAKLSSPALPIPLCINIVALLKRLAICSDRELRYIFLHRRFAYVDSALQEARSLSPSSYSYIGKVTNVLKSQLCEVVTQYDTCFPFSADTHHRLSAYDSDVEVPAADPLYDQVLRVIQHYRQIVSQQVTFVTSGGELASLLEQGMSCCTVLSKVQLDVAPLIVSLFTGRIYGLFEQHMDATLQTFTVALRSHTFSGKWNSSINAGGGAASLLTFHPIAYATNEFLTGCNEIRKCAAVTISPKCLNKAKQTLSTMVTTLCDVYCTSALEGIEIDHFLSFAKVFLDEFVPHCSKAVDTLFDTTFVQGSKKEIVAPLMKILAAVVATTGSNGHATNGT